MTIPLESKTPINSAVETKLKRISEIKPQQNIVKDKSKIKLKLLEIVLPIYCFGIKTFSKKS
jgi:hypothetical protein